MLIDNHHNFDARGSKDNTEDSIPEEVIITTQSGSVADAEWVETIRIEELTVNCIVGVLPRERQREQPLLVDIIARADFSVAAESGQLKHTVDYVKLAEATSDFIRQGKFHLLETLIRKLACQLCQQFGFHWLRLIIRKPQAMTQAKAAAVSLFYRHHPNKQK